MSLISYDTTDPRNFALHRLLGYTDTTGAISLHTVAVFGDTSKSITSWKVAACHPGLAYFGNGAKMCKASFAGGFPNGIPVTDYPYALAGVHLDGVKGFEGDIKSITGQMLLPKNSFQAQVSTSSVAVGTGTKNFAIATGLPSDMFAENKPVYASGNTVATAEDQMSGYVVSYDSGTGFLETTMTSTQGSGTLADWRIAFDRQSMYLQTGTNTDLVLKEWATEYGNPAASAGIVQPILSDTKAANGGGRVGNIVTYDTYSQFAATTPVDGTLYYIVDTHQIYIGSTFFMQGGKIHPGYVSALNYSVPSENGTTLLIATKARATMHPIIIKAKCTIASLGMHVNTTPGIGSTAKLAIYDSTGTNGRPGALLSQSAATVDTTTTGSKTSALLANVTVYPGIYWIGAMHDWATTAPTVTTWSSISPFAELCGSTTVSGAILLQTTSGGGYVYSDVTYASGFSSTFGAATEVAGNAGTLCTFIIA
jgi:hypothetical protein